jgi:hypothetical protein
MWYFLYSGKGRIFKYGIKRFKDYFPVAYVPNPRVWEWLCVFLKLAIYGLFFKMNTELHGSRPPCREARKGGTFWIGNRRTSRSTATFSSEACVSAVKHDFSLPLFCVCSFPYKICICAELQKCNSEFISDVTKSITLCPNRMPT